MSTTLKQSSPDASGEAKINFEAKLKSTVRDDAHEVSIKQDGNVFWEMKGNKLQVSTKFSIYIKIRNL